MDRENHLHELLLRIVGPLVMGPFGSPCVDSVRLGGVVRAGLDHTRVILRAGVEAPAGVAVEFTLVGGDGAELDVDAAVDWLRTLTAADLRAAVGEVDSHGNVVVHAMDAGFSADRRAGQYDMNYFSMLRQFLYGGGRLWFEDIFSVSGFLVLNPRSHRLYVTEGATGEIIGIDLPLTEADGTVSPGRGGTFPSVLPSLIEYDGLKSHRPVASRDDYCARIYDLSEWI